MTLPNQLSETAIIRAVAEEACQRCTRKVIKQLQSMDEALLSGDDSGLTNTWEEICVQVQYEESVSWDVYAETVNVLVEAGVRELPQYEREAIWLLTPAADEWDCEEEDSRDPYPVLDADIVNYLLDSHIYVEAGRWSNQRIRAYLDHKY